MSALSFDATQVAPQTARIHWPKGKYKVAISTSEVKDVGAKGSGNKGIAFGAKALEMIGAPVGFQLPGSLLLWNINFINSNETAQRIGQSELSAVMHACGVMKISDTGNLHGQPFVVDVTERFEQSKNEDQSLKVDDQGKPVGVTYNDIKGYYKADGSPVVASNGPGAAAAPVASGPPPGFGGAFTQGPATQAPPVAAAPIPPPPAVPTPITLPPAPVAAPPQQFYVNHAGANHHAIGIDGVRAKVAELGVPADTVMVNLIGSPDWKKASEVLGVVAAAPAPVAPAGDTPPWGVPQQ